MSQRSEDPIPDEDEQATLLVAIVDEYSARVGRGEAVDVDSLARRMPETKMLCAKCWPR